ncbi:hypothetical protein ACUOFU_07400 [Microbacterium arabinogalactanolyticum]|uniref:hypothetical protein n=1 Tax=Microbacterium arabinogalactanolyticum TaxID=69365 RepID=UPI00404483E6
MDAEERTALWPWIVLVIVAPVVAFLSVGMQSGYCVDAAPGSGAESFCVTGPVLGPGVIIVLAFCGLLTAVALYRIVRIAIRRRG